jgi:hypothetical protein
MDISYGDLVKLSDMPKKFTVSVDAPPANRVEVFLNEKSLGSKSKNGKGVFQFTSDDINDLYIEGIYKLSAVADGDSSDSCTMMIEVDYNNPTKCEGIVQQFALWDVESNAIVPGFEVLADGQTLELASLPSELTVVAVANGRGSSLSYFWDDGDEVWVEQSPPYSASGTLNGKPVLWSKIRETGTYTIKAKLRDRLMNPEPDELACSITLNVVSHHECPTLVSSFSVIDAETEKPVPGFESVSGNHAIDLGSTSGYLTVVANGPAEQVRFLVNGTKVREEGKVPFALAGDNSVVFHSSSKTTYKAYKQLSTPGTYVIEAYGRKNGQYESTSGMCSLTLTTIASEPPSVPKFPAGGQDCTAAHVESEQEGSIDFLVTPIKMVGGITDKTVTFQTMNGIVESTLDWLTASFVTPSGVEVCDKVDSMDFKALSVDTYEAKCFDGFAYVDIYAHSSAFLSDKATADFSVLPPACKGDASGNVVKYTFVMSCDCANVDVPPEVVGSEDAIPPICVGATSNTWGDPHIVSYTNKKWDCQAEGEFVLTKATIKDADYDFKLHSRFSKFGHDDLAWSFNSGMVAKQDVTVEISYGEEPTEKSNMFNNLAVNFFVDGVPRFFHEGSGDHRVIVSRDGYNIHTYFTSTGISIRTLVRPIEVSGHITNKIPGSMSTYVCMPENNQAITEVAGLTGSYTQQYVNTTGHKVSISNREDFCVNTWCVKDAGDSLFTFEEGTPYDFDFYNKCNDPARRELEVVDETPTYVWSEEYADIWAICGTVGNATQCLQDGYAMGIVGAELAAESILLDEELRLNGLLTESSNGCCSFDFKTCVAADTCEYADDENNCAKCASPFGDATFKWLELGSWDYDDDTEDAAFQGCKARGVTCGSTEDCCPDMTCSGSGVCEPDTNFSSRRLLHNPDAVFERKDVGDMRSISPLQSEL